MRLVEKTNASGALNNHTTTTLNLNGSSSALSASTHAIVGVSRPWGTSVNVSVGEGNHTLHLRVPRWLAASTMVSQ